MAIRFDVPLSPIVLITAPAKLPIELNTKIVANSELPLIGAPISTAIARATNTQARTFGNTAGLTYLVRHVVLLFPTPDDFEDAKRVRTRVDRRDG